jgi:group I intron endonuclease
MLIDWISLSSNRLHRPGVYLVVNTANGKGYVGISNNVYRRYNEHWGRRGMAPILVKAIAKYGLESFVFVPLAYSVNPGDTDHLPEIEAEFITALKTYGNHGYNVQRASGAVGPYGPEFAAIVKAAFVQPETKAKRSASAKARMNSPENKAKYAAIKHEWHAIPENKERVIASMREISRRPEVRAATSARLKGVPKSPEAIAKMTAKRQGFMNITDGISTQLIRKIDPFPDGWRHGKTQKRLSPESQVKAAIGRAGKIIITDGITERRILPDAPIPDGWRKGRSKPTSFCDPAFAKKASGLRSGLRRHKLST